ncbi:MAG TPA: 4Fe-4S binding protein [Halobacteria archaeon]|jgi:ferredoxin|nr:4Fe-4S binding protein [Halobacteria archaeon]
MINVDRYKCGYCGTCVSVCPEAAIDLLETFININDSMCKACNICVKICPIGALEVPIDEE